MARACAPYVDAVSCNLNPTLNDGTFPRFLLESLHALTGKPIIVGEFYLSARENRSGNQNSHGVCLYQAYALSQDGVLEDVLGARMIRDAIMEYRPGSARHSRISRASDPRATMIEFNDYPATQWEDVDSVLELAEKNWEAQYGEGKL